MLALMAAMVLIALIVGPTLLTGQPMLLVIGVVLAGAVLVLTRRRSALTGRR
jgi:LPXTG-motif cell wall-anchored protein